METSRARLAAFTALLAVYYALWALGFVRRMVDYAAALRYHFGAWW